MVNGRQCRVDTLLSSGNRVILIPKDVAALWRALGRQNLGMGIVLDSGLDSIREGATITVPRRRS